MIRINKFPDNIKKKYADEIYIVISKIYDKIQASFKDTPFEDLFLNDDGTLSEDKVKDFLKMDYSDVLKNHTLKKYIDDILTGLNNVSKKLQYEMPSDEKYKKWDKLPKEEKSKRKYLEDLFNEDVITRLGYDQDTISLPEKINSFKLYNAYVQGLTDQISAIFNYDHLSQVKDKDVNRHGLLRSLNVDVCPYCNRQYITTWIKAGDSSAHTSADLDHFFPKDKFPLFSLSLFNFVPSCQICNSRMKGEQFNDGKIIPVYPYEEEFGENGKFAVDLDADSDELLNIWLGISKTDPKITIEINEDSEISDKIKRSIDLYNLKEIYHSHGNYVSELIIKKRLYDTMDYKTNLKNILKDDNAFKLLFSDSDNIDKFLEMFMYGYDWRNGDDCNRPLSKLTRDILEDL